MTAARKPISYAWALHQELTEVSLEALTPTTAEGFDYALALAANAQERSQNPRAERLTVEQLADEHGLAAATIRARIALARRQLFGVLSDAAITKRTQRQRGRRRKQCAQDGCTNLILPPAHGNRRYCPIHETGQARTARCRATKSA
jgi:hypothetical protein